MIEVGGHEQRLLHARRHVRIEPARLVVRGDRLLEKPAVSARVDETREDLGIVAVPGGLVQEPHERLLRMTDVGLEVGVVLVRRPRAAGSARARGGTPPRRALRCPAWPPTYLPITRCLRPSCAQAGANRGSSSTHR